jgi:hypothetical protein
MSFIYVVIPNELPYRFTSQYSKNRNSNLQGGAEGRRKGISFREHNKEAKLEEQMEVVS